uniref:Uncharacterized protein n=1 Tax=viral metagenome TaxID=1070528 RepID=A0A6C0JTS5_9ZZZZ
MTMKKIGYSIFYENHREINERLAGMYEYVVFETKEEAQKVVDSLNNKFQQYFVLLENGMTEEEFHKKEEERRDYNERYQKASEAKRQHNALVWDYHNKKDRMQKEYWATMKKIEDEHEKERYRLVCIMNLVPGI